MILYMSLEADALCFNYRKTLHKHIFSDSCNTATVNNNKTETSAKTNFLETFKCQKQLIQENLLLFGERCKNLIFYLTLSHREKPDLYSKATNFDKGLAVVPDQWFSSSGPWLSSRW